MINSHNGTSLMKDRRESTTSSARERRKRNRRAFPRWVLGFDVRLSWESHSVTGRGYEIGAGGISLTAERELPAEAEIDVEYRLPQLTPVNVKGAVCHVEGTRFGIEFLNLGMRDRLVLVEYCENLRMA